jgi:hypothetical protein
VVKCLPSMHEALYGYTIQYPELLKIPEAFFEPVNCWCTEKLLVLYLAIVPKLFIRSRSVLVESLGSLSVGSYHLQMGII